MKKFMWLILALCLALPLAGCARVVELQPIATRDFSFSSFNAIESDSKTRDFLVFGSTLIVPVELLVTKSDSYRVSLTANQNIFDFIQLSQTGQLLKITVDDKKIANRDAVVKIEIAMPELKTLNLKHGNMQAAVASASDHFEANISGDSKLKIDLQAGPAAFKVSSSSDVTLSGTASELSVDISGDSKLNCSLKTTGRQILKVSSASDVILRGESHSLEADISGDSALDLDQRLSTASFKVSSASDVSGKIQTGGLTIDASGDSRIEISGSAQNAVLRASSASDLLLSDLAISAASITMTGASRANLKVSGQLDIDLSGASDLKYRGAPEMGNVKISGDSKIEPY